jgi:hypothetical protein
MSGEQCADRRARVVQNGSLYAARQLGTTAAAGGVLQTMPLESTRAHNEADTMEQLLQAIGIQIHIPQPHLL